MPPIPIEQTIIEVTESLLHNLQITATVVVIKEGEETVAAESADSYRVTIETAESGLLIGRHGETLNSIQLMLGVMVFKRLGKWARILVDVGNYRKMREESVTAMADRIAAEVEQTGQAVPLPYLSPLERRMVHMHLVAHPTVMSESVGEGRDRRLMIKPRALQDA